VNVGCEGLAVLLPRRESSSSVANGKHLLHGAALLGRSVLSNGCFSGEAGPRLLLV